ncbi:MAG: hypothetical protein QNI93_01240 [Kiloniellales bacterium]|nr:hypothetical protein [Kiloniellales bacterium]
MIWNPFRRRSKGLTTGDLERFFGRLARDQLGPGYGAAERRRDFRSVFATPAGRRVLWSLLDWCGLFRPVAVKGDPYETYHRDGRRDIGLRIIRTLEATAPQGEGTPPARPEERQG